MVQAPASAAADDRFARPDVAELTIESATDGGSSSRERFATKGTL